MKRYFRTIADARTQLSDFYRIPDDYQRYFMAYLLHCGVLHPIPNAAGRHVYCHFDSRATAQVVAGFSSYLDEKQLKERGAV